MRVKVTAFIDPEDDEKDEGDPTGLSSEGFDHFQEALMELGLDEIEFEREKV